MKHQFKLALLFSFIFLICTPDLSRAVGLGIYLSPYNTGNSTINWDDSYFADTNWAIKYWGIGFLFDTRIAKRGILNYRLNIGYENVEYREKRSEGGRNDSHHRIRLDNTLGFGIVQTQLLRIWCGPQFRLSFEGFPGPEAIDASFYEGDGTAWGVGIAPVLGINTGLNNTISLSIDLGYSINYGSGTSSTGISFSRERESWHSDITENEFFFNLSFIFRIRDVFK
jgi:hypothetical protein